METLGGIILSKVAVVGHLNPGKSAADGQTVKTRTLLTELQKYFGAQNVAWIDTHNWRAKPLRLFSRCFSVFKSTENVIMLPAQNGLTLLTPVFVVLRHIFNRRLFYIVIGGWLPSFLEKHKWLCSFLRYYEVIFVETSTMADKLAVLGLDNIRVMPNFKSLTIVSENHLRISDADVLRVCTFSRVMREKGIEDAIEAVVKANTRLNTELFHLDIYGAVEESYSERFSEIIADSPNYINYKGVVAHDNVVEVLRNYYLMLFPTFYEGEGFAGTILDAFSSGLPVIASDWRYNAEIINRGTGSIFPVRDTDALTEILVYYAKNRSEVFEMRKNCVREAVKYTPAVALRDLFLMLGD